ncbi:MAG: hypothetical protein KGQ59_02850 [Bdellovibrionales bacterium]|nr:hypothetical protein [Bdellovibrionales bacterium]
MNKLVCRIIAILLALSPTAKAYALPEVPWNSLIESASGASSDYQIGSEWGKKPVIPEVLNQAKPEFIRAASATASYGGGTAFYLGKINERHLMGTNHHVQPSMNCQGSVRFEVLKKSYPCKKVFGHWSAADFALFEISVPSSDEPGLLSIGKNFEFDHALKIDEPLLTIGFGIANNPNRKLMFNQDSDCKVFSSEIRYMGDPDEYNPGEYQAWSFANGCDVSHGDSGSAMVNRDTGAPVGIIWTGRIPKSRETQDSRNLVDWIQSNSPKIWTELSYAVPASKIREVLSNFLASNPAIDVSTRETITAFLR